MLGWFSTIFLGGMLLFYGALAFWCFYSAWKSWRQELRDRKREAERKAAAPADPRNTASRNDGSPRSGT